MSRNQIISLNLVLLFSLILPAFSPIINIFAEDLNRIEGPTGLFRTDITIHSAYARTRLDDLGILILTESETSATVLASEDQLEDLARLRFQPWNTQELGEVIEATAQFTGWLAHSMRPILASAQGLREGRINGDLATSEFEREMTDLLGSITEEQKAGLLSLLSLDDDGDGLTNTEEVWWCTDPANPNSDQDASNFSDGEEVAALLDFTLPRSVRWGYGPPFGPPAPWPDWNGADGDPDTPACNDGDWDTIPDLAEAFVVGTRVPKESTDNDKFDDGQELFGITYCPGAPTNCGYGSYPHVDYWQFITESMPNWVEPPGDNPFVAGTPVIEVIVVPGSWTVERVTTITTSEGQMTQTTNSYDTSVTSGQESSIANTETWNSWEEVSESVETPININIPDTCSSPGSLKCKVWGYTQVFGGLALTTIGTVGTAAGLAACVPTVGLGCVVAAAVGGATAYLGGKIIDSGVNDFYSIDQVQNDNPTTIYNPAINSDATTGNGGPSLSGVTNMDTQGTNQSLDGILYAINEQGDLLARGLQDISYQISRPRFTETRTSGQSWGGAQTVTNSVYEEHTITEGQAFTSSENWSTAWAVDSSHAADLTFTYEVHNNGTEYAREVTNLVFNIYLGDDPNPIISYPAWQQFDDGMLTNMFPGDSNTFASMPVELTLDQMRRFDLGERVTIVVEDFSYGVDELFYQNAVDGGLTVFIEDGVEDDDELVDTYVIPTWGTETVQDVLQRYFPAGTDADGNLNSLWTPEFNGINPPIWNEHFLSDIAWWNIYFTDPSTGNAPLYELSALAGDALLFRFNRDSDRDGYQDRVEMRYGTDKDDPASHPQPEVLAGYTTTRDGDVVTVLLKVANMGTFDAYGIDAVMYAPDDTTTIGNNTVGGNGRVRSGNQVAVGSLILSPDVTGWTGTADPYASGYYSGDVDRVYTFTVNTAGTVGSGTALLDWTDGLGGSGTLDLGASYQAPLPSAIANGLEVGFDTGTLLNGQSFTVQALTPRDTFTYTVNTDPFTEPVIVVSYSDPQGSHKFVTPVELTSLDNDLGAHSGQMLDGVGVAILTTGVVSETGINTTNFVINNVHSEAIEDGHLYLNFVSDGALVLEIPVTTTIPVGPSVIPIDWSTSQFAQTYDSAADNLLIAFWTDAQNNIIDSAARPLNTFLTDPQPLLGVNGADTTWDFGTARQGTLMLRQVILGNTGYLSLLTYVGATPGLGISGPLSSPILPADMAVYSLTLNTEYLPAGPYTATIPIRTSDIGNAFFNLTIMGAVLPFTPDSTQEITLRPLDFELFIPGSQNQGSWVTYTHNLGPAPQSLHPVFVLSEDYTTLWGVGRNTADFGDGSSGAEIFGDGSDGNKITLAGNQYIDSKRDSVAANANAGQPNLTVSNASIFDVGDEVFILQTQGTNSGTYEFARILSKAGNTLILQNNLANSFVVSGSSKAQVIFVPNYENVTVPNGSILTAHSWFTSPSTGGVLVFRAAGDLVVEAGGVIRVNEVGFRGGISGSGGGQNGQQGESELGLGTYVGNGTCNGIGTNANGSGGGGGNGDGTGPDAVGGGGGGGGYGGTGGRGGCLDYHAGGQGGIIHGDPSLSTLFFGGGGGAGGNDNNDTGSGDGGRGGGIIIIFAQNILINGVVQANGAVGQTGISYSGGGGGGAGGGILLTGGAVDLGPNLLTAIGGGAGSGQGLGSDGGAGGKGRIHVSYCNSISGSTNPVADTTKIDCFLVEQIEQAPFNGGKLNLPESFSDGRVYQIQYGRLYEFGSADELTKTVRISKQLYGDMGLDILVNNTGAPSAPFDFSLDVGADGIVDWNHNEVTPFPATLTVTDVVGALNAYLVGRTDVAWGDDIDVPIRIIINRQADVYLTNLALSLQVNQPDALLASTIDTGTDRPMDWPIVITGSHSQGEVYSFTHSLGPQPDSIHPCLVYNLEGAELKGFGRYCSDFIASSGIVPLFGNGRDGALIVDSGQTISFDDINPFTPLMGALTAGDTEINVISTSGFAPSDLIIIHQTRGNGFGRWEIAQIADVSSSLTLTKGIQNDYLDDNDTNQVQVLKLPQFLNCTINTDGILTVSSWDGQSGGIIAFLCMNQTSIDGEIDLVGKGLPQTIRSGFGGPSLPGLDSNGDSGASGQGWGGGRAGGGGGGGGNANFGTNGTDGGSNEPDGNGEGGLGGDASGNLDLTLIEMGGGGGQGGNAFSQCNGNFWHQPGNGGSGGGILLIFSRFLSIGQGKIISNGINGAGTPANNPAGGSGGGAGGSVLLRAQELSIGNNLISVNGGSGGTGSTYCNGLNGGDGGQGSVGRLRFEFCDFILGTTNPSASEEPITCHIIEQVEQPDYRTINFYLPESFSNGASYIVQFGRRLQFPVSDTLTTTLRLNRQVYGTAGLDMLFSNTGVFSDTLDFCLDLGDDGSCEYTYSAPTEFPAEFNLTGLADGLNDYLLTRDDVPWGDPVDVPVGVFVNRQADVMLTNLALTPVGAKTRYLRLNAEDYGEIFFSILFEQTGVSSGPLAFHVDVGADGTVDWSYSGTPAFPLTIESPNLAAAFNAYLAGRTGEVDVPIRITPSPYIDTALDSFRFVPVNEADAQLTTGDIAFGASSPTEGDNVSVTADIHNPGTRATDGVMVAFFATLPGFGEWYIGSDYLFDISAGGTTQASISWDTLGFTGDVPVRVEVDPFDRLTESNETNNSATKNLTILTRPDLHVTSITLSDPEPVVSETVTVTVVISNAGQTSANSAGLILYDDNPGSGGTEIESTSVNLPGLGSIAIDFTWTPSMPGPYRLFALSDQGDGIDESDEANNQTWLDTYVGFAGAILIDSGGGGDQAYSPSNGYGYLDGQPSTFCGTDPEQSQRQDDDGEVGYQFDHLLPGHFYHLDITLRECDGLGRQENILVDGNLITGTVDLLDGAAHRFSLLLDPALYADNSITVTIEEIVGYDAVVSEVKLFDIDYRYSDSGGSKDPAYGSGSDYGWLDGVINAPWGTLPYQTRRIDLADSNPEDDPDNEIRYRYSNLDPGRPYQIGFTFYHQAGTTIGQKILIDGLDTGAVVSLISGQVTRIILDVPLAAYLNDGDIVVQVQRSDGAASGAFVNEIALEEVTTLAGNLPQISEVVISNVTDSSFTVSWVTDIVSEGYLHFGPTTGLGSVAHDVRGGTTKDDTHYVTVSGLTAQTTYYFDVFSGLTTDNNAGAHFQVTTGQSLAPTSPDTVFGQVFLDDGSTFAGGAIVYLQVEDVDTVGSSGQSAMLSALVSSGDGFWFTNLAQARLPDGSAHFNYSAIGDTLHVRVEGANECDGAVDVDTSDDSPVASITLSCAQEATLNLVPGWNLIALPIDPEANYLAQSLLDEVNAQGGACSEIDRWLNGGWDGHVDGFPFNNFPVEMGAGYFLKCSATSSWTFTGLELSAPKDLSLVPGWNLVGLPYPVGAYLAQSLLDDINGQGGSCSEIDRWLNGGWDGHVDGFPFNNFPIETDEGYFIKCSSSSTFEPSGTGAEGSSGLPPESDLLPALEPAANPTINQVWIADVTDVSVTVIWLTDLPATGFIEYGFTTDLGQVVESPGISAEHRVQLTGLEPGETYYLGVNAGEGVRSDLPPLTLPLDGDPGEPWTVFGQALYPYGLPAYESTAIVELIDQASGEVLQRRSGDVDGWGYWHASLAAVTECAAVELKLTVIAPNGMLIEETYPGCETGLLPAVIFPASPFETRFFPVILRE